MLPESKQLGDVVVVQFELQVSRNHQRYADTSGADERRA
jgi:hypothetical protein